MSSATLRARHAGAVALVAGAAFVAITLLYRVGATLPMDRAVLIWTRGVQTDWLEGLGGLDDAVFQPTATFAAALVLSLVLWRLGPRWSWCAPLTITLVVLAEVVVRNGWARLMHPSALIAGIESLFGVHYQVAGSFPSGHVARAMFLAVIALYTLPRWASVPIVVLALTSIPARLYTEAHRLSDVLGGAALGIFVAALALWTIPLAARQITMRRRRWQNRRRLVSTIRARAGSSPRRAPRA